MNPKAKSFEFVSYVINSQRTEASFSYSVHFENQESLHFTEKIQFDAENQNQDAEPEIIDRMLHSIHILLGISYWKLYCPQNLIISTQPLSPDMARFWGEVYLKGLGEFYYRNNLPLATAPHFPSQDVEYWPVELLVKSRSLLGIGGGKDSLVAYEMLKEKNEEVTALVVETQKGHPLIDHVLGKINIQALRVKRFVDPKLFEQNKLDYTYNGHVPISAVFAFIGLLTAYLYDYKYIIVGNEQSANSENVVLDGISINHQWSKSAEFERLFQNYTRTYITPNIVYFSLLRPYYELKITEKFVSYNNYLHIFSGCNRNFKIHEKVLEGKLWCGECAKCAFIFSLLTAFLPKTEVISIFGKNLYDDPNLELTYRELLGLKGVKPFDCVGTEQEVKVAFNRAHQKGDYSQDHSMKMFEEEVLARGEKVAFYEKEIFGTHDMSLIPEPFKKLI